MAVASTLPASLKGALILTLRFVGGMLDVRHPETWQEATEHVTFRWKPLLPETPVAAEIEQRPPEGARKESLFSVGTVRAPPRGGAPPRSWARKPQDLFFEERMLLRSGLFEGVLGSPHSLFALHASKEPDLVGTGWPTVPILEHGGEETSQTLPHSVSPPET